MQAEGRLRQIIWSSISLLVLALLLAPAIHDGFRGQSFELALLAVALTLWGTAVYVGSSVDTSRWYNAFSGFR